ncbi:MAG: leucyl aminopeptidase family protein [Proteobacteria bacterium]|nr:leucyl aminopeptidase family protein [Pseudomonadota bacterium]
MIANIDINPDPNAIPIWPLRGSELTAWQADQTGIMSAWCRSSGFTAAAGKFILLPAETGGLAGVLLGLGAAAEQPGDYWAFGTLANSLPPGRYRIEGDLQGLQAYHATLAWALAGYRFTRYRGTEDADEAVACLCLAGGVDGAALKATVKGSFLARDLINTPASDMGPAELADAALALAAEYGGTGTVIVGDDLLTANYPAIHAVGRASTRAPRLIDLRWGATDAPRLTLVGKGVCFDTGGLDLKAAAGMLKMKKDMGGAATVLGLAAMVMAAELPVHLRVLIPAVENAVAGNAYRPGDVLQTRKGLTVEIGNTDAEGRIVLCDALAEADAETPDLIIDIATLTGAARVALGPDLPAFFTGNDRVAAALLQAGQDQDDPSWRLPLFAPYAERLKSNVADYNNVSEGPFAGAITAALFMQAFVSDPDRWLHIDSYGWNDKDRPGRPAGGEGLAMRALFAMLVERFGPGSSWIGIDT